MGDRVMKSRVFLLLLATGILGFAGTASALTFTLDSYAVLANSSDPGLVLFWNPILTTPTSVDLEVGETAKFRLFEIGTHETWVNPDDMFWKEIYVSFNFSDPTMEGDITGSTRGRFVFQDSVVRWDGPQELSFGDGGLFTITLSNVSFGVPGSTDVWATIRYAQAETQAAPAPEPATGMLLGTGIAGLIGLRRLSLFRKKAA
jgi:hypothetical protein